MKGYKALTHDYRSPIQVGAPIWDGTTLPWHLPPTALDTSPQECGAGWNFCVTPAAALSISRLWPDGRPSVILEVETRHYLKRGDKCRATELTLLRQLTEGEISQVILSWSQVFAPHHVAMAEAQIAWRGQAWQGKAWQGVVRQGNRNPFGWASHE